jgi:cell division protein FtsQ
LRGRLRAPSLRILAIVAIAVALLGLAYAAARFTSLFALRELEVAGGSKTVQASVREAALPFLGESLVSRGQGEVRRRRGALPTVRSVAIDRAFPHTLRISVVQERALAVVRNGREAWLVSERGRVIRPAPPEASAARPVVWTASEPDLAPGDTIESESVRLALAGLRHLPASFPEPVRTMRVDGRDLTLLLDSGAEIRLGKAESTGLKLAVAARVLRSMRASERAALAYLDVSVPERAVASSTLNSQLEG